MAITNILRDFAGSVSIVRIMSSDNLTAVAAAGYLTAQQANIEQINSGMFAWVPSDFILVFASNGWGLFTISTDFSTLNSFSTGGSISLTNNLILQGNVSNIAAPVTLSAAIDNAIGAVQGNILYRSASAWSVLAPGTAGQILISGGAAANPSWAAAGGSGTVNSGAINDLAFYGSAGTAVSGLATANDGVLITSNTGVPSWLPNSGTAGFVLTANSAAPPSWQAAAGGGVTSLQVQSAAFLTGTNTNFSSTAYTVTLSPALTSYVDCQILSFTPQSGNSGTAPTVNFGGGVANINIGGGFPLIPNDMAGNTPVFLQYSANGNYFTLLNPNYSFTIFRAAAGNTAVTTYSISTSTVGAGLKIAEGSNAKQGIATLSGGTVVVSNTAVTANSRIFLTIQSPGGTLGSVYVAARTAGTSFTITSTSAIDTSVVAYEIFEPA